MQRDRWRVALEVVGWSALSALAWVSYAAQHGAHPLAARIPTHFGADGQPDAWGSPATLWLLPIIGFGLSAMMTAVSFFPSSFNFPVRVTPANRTRLEALALRLISSLKAELACLFLWIQVQIIHSVRAGAAKLSPGTMPVTLIVVFSTIIAFVVLMSRARDMLAGQADGRATR